MAFRRFLTATLLLAVSIYGDHELGENKDLTGFSESDTPANLKVADYVSRQDDEAKFVGINICGFDFGW